MKNISLLLITVMVCLACAEGAFRVLGYAPRTLEPNRFFLDGLDSTWSVPDKELGWINRQGVSVSIEEGAAPMTFWSHGRRASRPDSTNPSGNAPIMIVGGSNAQSYGVRDESSFPYLLAKQFSDYWVENFGNGGFGTVQTFLLTKRMLKEFYEGRAPALIIATFADSHVARNVSDQSWVYSISDSAGRYVSPPHFRIDGPEFSFHPHRTIGLWPLESHSALVTATHHTWLQTIAHETAGQGIPVTRHAFNQLSDLAKAHGSKFLVVVMEDYREIAEDVFKDAEFPVLNCSGFERTAPQEYLLGGGGHPNVSFHEHFARCMGNWIKAHLLSPDNVQSP